MKIDELHKNFPAAADYLVQIYLIGRDYSQTTNLQLSKRLHVSKPAVTQSIKRLKRLALVTQESYGIIHLTPEGLDIAKAVLKRHYLLEHVLVKILGFPWDESDREAKRLQVIISEELTAHINKKLNYPTTCPH